MFTTVRVAACAAAFIVVLTPAVARADKVVTAEVVFRYDASKYTIDQGEKLTFRNTDTVSPGNHDVTADATGPDGTTPIFRSQTIDDGQESVVDGVQQLKPGEYTFHCSIHQFMKATLHVNDSGTPAPAPPPSDQPAPQSQQPAARDTTKPHVHAALRPTSLRKALKAGRVLARVTASELVTLRVSLVGRVGRRDVRLASGAATDGAPRKAVDFVAKLTAAGRRALRARARLRVTLVVSATDQAGNRTTTRIRRTLRR